MGRLIIGAAALVAGLAAALGVIVRHRGAHPDELLPLDPAPPLGRTAPARREGSAAHAPLEAHDAEPAPSIEADFGPVDPPSATGADSVASAPRKPRAPSKASSTKRAAPVKAKTTAGATKGNAAAGNAAAGNAAKKVASPKRPTRSRTSPAATPAESLEPTPADGADVADGS
jgi:hypothetical protein